MYSSECFCRHFIESLYAILQADVETDEVYAQMTLIPVSAAVSFQNCRSDKLVILWLGVGKMWNEGAKFVVMWVAVHMFVLMCGGHTQFILCLFIFERLTEFCVTLSYDLLVDMCMSRLRRKHYCLRIMEFAASSRLSTSAKLWRLVTQVHTVDFPFHGVLPRKFFLLWYFFMYILSV